MKKMNFIKVVGSLLVGINAFATADQFIEVEVFSALDNGRISKNKAECEAVEQSAKIRLDAFLKANPSLDPKQLNVSTKFVIDYDRRGGIGGSIEPPQRIQSCLLRVRLNDDTRKLNLGKSQIYFTGRAKLPPCMELKNKIDQDVNVIFSQVNNNLLRCNVKPIISINE
jgi:hypothetical protein